MKAILILIVLAGLASCTEVTVKTTDPDSGVPNEVTVKGVRRLAISTNDKGTTVIAGQVLINDETVQVLAKEAAQVADKGN